MHIKKVLCRMLHTDCHCTLSPGKSYGMESRPCSYYHYAGGAETPAGISRNPRVILMIFTRHIRPTIDIIYTINTRGVEQREGEGGDGIVKFCLLISMSAR